MAMKSEIVGVSAAVVCCDYAVPGGLLLIAAPGRHTCPAERWWSRPGSGGRG